MSYINFHTSYQKHKTVTVFLEEKNIILLIFYSRARTRYPSLWCLLDGELLQVKELMYSMTWGHFIVHLSLSSIFVICFATFSIQSEYDTESEKEKQLNSRRVRGLASILLQTAH